MWDVQPPCVNGNVKLLRRGVSNGMVSTEHFRCKLQFVPCRRLLLLLLLPLTTYFRVGRGSRPEDGTTA